MWLMLGWLLGRGRHWQSAEEREWHRRRGHPWLFGLALGTVVLLFAGGSIGYGLLMLAAAVWLLART
jgi:hypothetical protein